MNYAYHTNPIKLYCIITIKILILSIFLSACHLNSVKEIKLSEVKPDKDNAIIIFEVDDKYSTDQTIEFARVGDDQCFIWNKIEIDPNKKLNIFILPEGEYKSLSVFQIDGNETSVSFNIKNNMIMHFGTIYFSKNSKLFISKYKSEIFNSYDYINISPSDLYSRKVCTP